MAHSEQGRWKVVVIAFLAIAVPFVANEWFGEKMRDSKLLQPLRPEFWYRAFGPGEPIRTRVHEFRILAISRENAPESALGENRCTHRAFMATLLNRLADDASVNPRLVVIDKWYDHISGDVCTGRSNPTEDLRRAIQKLSKKITVVIAVESFDQDEVKQFCSEVKPESVGDDMVLANFERFDLPAQPEDGADNCDAPKGNIRFGLARMNSDARKVPLGWDVYCSCKEVGRLRAKLWRTLAVEAAAALDPDILNLHGLKELQASVTHPYIKLLPEESEEGGQPQKTFTQVSAESVVDGDPKALEQINQRVVIIGEPWKDTHKTDEGVIDGPSLQANYMAALLSENTLRPVSPVVNRVISLAWLAWIFAVFYCWKPLLYRPGLGIIVSLALTIGFAILFSVVITRQFQAFADVAPPTILEIIGLYLARRIEMLLEPRG